jgi:hypothetical protein
MDFWIGFRKSSKNGVKNRVFEMAVKNLLGWILSGEPVRETKGIVI